MILDDTQIAELIKTPAHEELVRRAHNISRNHAVHVKGIGLQTFLENAEVKGYENATSKKLRHALAKPATVPIFSRELGVFKKAHSASGYNRYLDFGSAKELHDDMLVYLSGHIGEGYSMSQFMECVWGDRIHYDPTTVLLIELPVEQMGNRPEPYIVFRSCFDIHDIKANGLQVEYVILKEMLTKADRQAGYDKKYRVIDQARDVIVLCKGEEKTYVAAIDHKFGRAPAVVISNQYDAECRHARQTFIWQAVGTADEYLLDASIHTISKKLHDFPQKWMYPQKCKGKGCRSGNVVLFDPISKAETGQVVCSECNGSGQDVSVGPDKVVVKPLPDANNPDIGDPFGYVNVPTEVLESQVKNLDRLGLQIGRAVWGTPAVEVSESPNTATATGRMLDVKAAYDKLNLYSDNAEQVESLLTWLIGKIRYGESFRGCMIKYGRRYYLFTENELEQQYKAAKEAGVPVSVLDELAEEIIRVRFANDPLELSRQLKLFEIEPFAHMSVEQVNTIGVSTADKYMKIYFSDYVHALERSKPDVVFTSTAKELLALITEMNNEKVKEIKNQNANDDNA